MRYKYKLAVIGGGFMAKAIISGVIKSKFLKEKHILVCDSQSGALNYFKDAGIDASSNNGDAADFGEYVLFCVKPQNLNDVFVSLKDKKIKKAISILAGVKKEKFKSFDPDMLVARCMPNTPCSIGEGVTAVNIEDFTGDSDKSFVLSVFNSIGKTLIVKEEALDAVTALSGSGPAYVYLFIKSLIEAGMEQGLNYQDAKLLTVSTLIGAGKMVEESFEDIDKLIVAVTSKKGTTERALEVFNENGFSGVIKKAVKAAKLRAEELSNQ